MKNNTDYTILIVIAILLFGLFLISCNGNNQKQGEAKVNTQPYSECLESNGDSIYYTDNSGKRSKIGSVKFVQDFIFLCEPAYRYKHIDRLTVDDRGLISFTWVEYNGERAGLDFVTIKGFNHWLRGEVDSVYNDDAASIVAPQIKGDFKNDGSPATMTITNEYKSDSIFLLFKRPITLMVDTSNLINLKIGRISTNKHNQ